MVRARAVRSRPERYVTLALSLVTHTCGAGSFGTGGWCGRVGAAAPGASLRPERVRPHTPAGMTVHGHG
ncbi:hypothetical protein SY2F82_60490 [Streptomyces sp. Y2F8-2]|nr:hypothetical protein SY2F82_60490 [Streptomyces sp. Y2F8-2]